MTRRWTAVVLAGLVTAACREAPPPPPGTIVLGTPNSPTSLDPGIGLDEASQRIHQLLFDSLLKIDDHLRIVPDLAVRFESADSQIWIAEIPPGVRFHDGREMTAADVVYTYRRFLDPAFVSGRKGAYRDLAAVDAVDRYTTAFRLTAPSAAFPANLVMMGIVPDGSAAMLRNLVSVSSSPKIAS